jgi:hypothetical protein
MLGDLFLSDNDFLLAAVIIDQECDDCQRQVLAIDRFDGADAVAALRADK